MQKSMTSLAPILAVALVAWGVLAGCAPRADVKVPTDTSREPYRFESEGQVPPPAESAIRKEVDHVDVFEETPVTDEVVTGQAVEPVREIQVEEAAEDSVVTGPGYRVQVFASGSGPAAESFKLEVEARLGLRAYVERLNGVFKVRVGDCRSRQEAEDLMQRCRDAGYKDAWIVASEVTWRRPPRE